MSRFPSDYFAARARFRNLATRLKWRLQTYPVAARGPQDEELTIEVACSPGPAKAPVLLITSGVHGIEGFFGSTIQTEAMQRFESEPLPSGIRCVMIHAISPYGFAHWRRFDENNVDPNRNFLLPGQAFSGSPPLYELCDPVLNPKHPPRWPDGFLLQAACFLARHGYSPLKQAIAGGQYDYPQGLFYGGAQPSESSQIILKHFPEWLADSEHVLHLDYHTGLGKWATYKLLVDPPLTVDQQQRAEAWFGASTLQAASPDGIDYHTRGSFGTWCAYHNQNRNYLHLCAEFGTFWTLRMLSTLRRENQAYHWAIGNKNLFQTDSLLLKESFGPSSMRWQAKVLSLGQQVLFQGLRGISHFS
jgi:hypothetical protein